MFFALFALGFVPVNKMLASKSQTVLQATQIEIPKASFNESCSSVSSITGSVGTHKFFCDITATSEESLNTILLSRNNFAGGGNLLKLLKSNLSIRNAHTLFAFLGQNEYRLSNADNRLIRSSHRYYVYALRHILI